VTQEKRAKDLANKLHEAADAVNTPDRNARSMLTDAGFWSAVADAIIEAVTPQLEGPQSVTQKTVQEDEPIVELEDLEEEKPKKRGRKR
jgi:hypothetical protein